MQVCKGGCVVQGSEIVIESKAELMYTMLSNNHMRIRVYNIAVMISTCDQVSVRHVKVIFE